MANKLISLTTLLCLITVLIIGRFDPSDPLFYFISIDPTVSGLRFIMVAAMLWIAFKTSFAKISGRNLVAVSGAALAIFGIASLLIPFVGTAIYNYLMPLDQLLLVEAGVLLSAAAFDKQIKPAYKESKPAKVPVRATV